MNNSTNSSTSSKEVWREYLRRYPGYPYAWAMVYRTVAGNPLVHMPAIADIARDDHTFVAIQKSAQVGISELLINRALHAADVGWGGRGNVMFLMPTQNQMDDVVQARFDPALQDNAHMRSRLQPDPPRRKGADSKRLKHFGPGYIHLRGADSRRQVASVPVDLCILDEFDQMEDGVLDLARKRLTSSQRGRLIVASTPSFPEAGINELILQSDQRRYYLPCPVCRLGQTLRWPENIDMKSARVVCSACRHPMNVLAKGRWIAEAPGNAEIHGYYLNRLLSPWANIPEMIVASKSKTPFALQEFQNSDLGETFVPPGGGLSIDDIDRCRGEYLGSNYAGQACDMGIDVGIRCHVVVRERRPDRDRHAGSPFIPRLWFAGDVGFDELDGLVERFNVQSVVIDAQPDLFSAEMFAMRQKRRAWLAQYDRHQSGHDPAKGAWNEPNRYHINRTQALDEMFQRFHDQAVSLPRDGRALGGGSKHGFGAYYQQLLAPKRTLERDGQGNFVARWIEGSRDDHYAHAELYCMLAARARVSAIMHRGIRF